MGFALPMVIVGGLILMIGAIILSARSFSSLTGSIRQNQAKQAEEIAESGANMIIQELNQNYPYLLVINCDVTNNSAAQQMQVPECDEGWSSYLLNDANPFGACSQRSQNPQNIMNVVYQATPGGKGFYRLRSYEFFGDQIQGGTAVIQVQGQLRHGSSDNQRIISSAILEKELTIVPKCCDLAPFETCSVSEGWKYGLTANSVALQTGDVIDENPNVAVSGANINCSSCTTNPPENVCTPWGATGQTISLSKQSLCRGLTNKIDIAEDSAGFVSGERSRNNIEIPDAPSWNTNWRTKEGGQMQPMTFVNKNETFEHLDHEGPHPDKSCYTEISNGKPITHCRINSIVTSDYSKFTIKPGVDGEIRFYIEGAAINLSGRQFFVPDGTKFGQFAIFGSNSTSSLNFSGGGEINAFLYMPKTKVSLSGGICNPLIEPLVLRGAAIVDRYEATGDCAQIRVPTDAGKTLCDNYGLCSTNSDSSNEDLEYVAVGTNRWDYVQMDR